MHWGSFTASKYFKYRIHSRPESDASAAIGIPIPRDPEAVRDLDRFCDMISPPGQNKREGLFCIWNCDGEVEEWNWPLLQWLTQPGAAWKLWKLFDRSIMVNFKFVLGYP